MREMGSLAVRQLGIIAAYFGLIDSNPHQFLTLPWGLDELLTFRALVSAFAGRSREYGVSLTILNQSLVIALLRPVGVGEELGRLDTPTILGSCYD